MTEHDFFNVVDESILFIMCTCITKSNGIWLKTIWSYSICYGEYKMNCEVFRIVDVWIRYDLTTVNLDGDIDNMLR